MSCIYYITMLCIQRPHCLVLLFYNDYMIYLLM